MADVQIAIVDQQNTQVALAVPGIQGPTGQTGDVAVAQDGTQGTPGIRFENDLDTGIYRPGDNQLAISTNGTGRLFIDANGDFGIGNSNPANYRLNLLARPGYEDIVIFSSSGTNINSRINIAPTGTGVGIINATANALALQVAGTERARITSDGKVGLGTSSPSTALHVVGAVRSSGNSYLGPDGTNWDTAAAYIANGSYGGGVSFIDGSNGFTLFADSSGSRFNLAHAATGGTPTVGLVYTNAGRVGIGVTSPSTLLHVSGASGTAFTLDGDNNYSSTASIFMNQGRSEIRTTINASGGNPGGSLLFRTRNNSGSLVDAVTIDSNQTVTINSAAGTNPLVVGDGGDEAMRVDASGRLLVGTSSVPSTGSSQYSLLVVRGYAGGATGAGDLSIQRGGAAASGFGANEQVGVLHFTDSAGYGFANIQCLTDGTAGSGDYPGRLVFSTNAGSPDTSPTERMRITQAGIVLIGATGLSGSAPDSAGVSIDQDGAFRTRIGANGNYQYEFNNASGSLVGYIQVNSGSVTYSTTSDYRLKENLQPLAGAAERIKQLPVYRFNFISDPDTQVDGFVAHEVQAVVPEAISGTKDAVHEDGSINPQGIDQSKLVPLLTAALQEAIGRIETLEVEVAALKTS